MHSDDRETALRAFDEAHARFATALGEHNTPVAALAYRPAGEDYALGGLGVHVAQVLEKYARVLESMPADDSSPVLEAPQPAGGEADVALVRDGFGAETRDTVLERVQAAHLSVVSAVRSIPQSRFRSAVPVIYLGAADPFPTSPANVIGWVHDHYTEHIDQIANLRSEWAATRSSS